MSNKFTTGRKAIAECDICGFRYQLKELRNLVVKTKETTTKACRQCWVPDQPQLLLGMYPVSDPQAIRDPRPDRNAYYASGILADGSYGGGSRIIQWGWNPTGGASGISNILTPNALVLTGYVGTVTVS